VVSTTVDSAVWSWRDCAVVIGMQQFRDVLRDCHGTAIRVFEPVIASQLDMKIDILDVILLI
jgi:hypothetical protein